MPLLVAALSLSACGRPAPMPDTVPASLCNPPPGAPLERLTILFQDRALPVDAPVARNAAEITIFPHLYETLAELDCNATPVPALAASWKSDNAKRVWVIDLHSGRKFWDGSRVDAEAVLRGWQWQSRRQRPDDPPWCWISPDSVRALTPLRLRIALRRSCPEFPHLLTHPALAALIPPAERHAPPLGSGPARPTEWLPGRLELIPSAAASPPPPWKQLQCRFFPRATVPEMLAAEPDLLLLRDRGSIAALRQEDRFQATDLPADHTYAWLPGPGAGPAVSPIGSGVWIQAGMRAALANQTLTAPADTAAGPAFRNWLKPLCAGDKKAGSPAPPPSPSGIAPTHRRGIAFDWTDPQAREIAQFLAAQATTHAPPGRGWSVHPMPPHEFRLALRHGTEVAQILRLDRGPGSPLLQRRSLSRRLPWITAPDNPPSHLVPLLTTHAVLFARPQITGIRWRADGALLLDRAGIQ